MGESVEIYAVGTGRITEDAWRKAFKQPGRPKAGSPRGPYKPRVEKTENAEICP